MSNPVVYIAFYPSDWLAGTRSLTATETGVYITLLAMMYEQQCPLDFETKRLARLCGLPAGSFEKVIRNLITQGKISQTATGLWNDRVEKELNRVFEKSTKAKASAEARWKSKRVKNAATTMHSGEQKSEGQVEKFPIENDSSTMRTQSERDANQNQNHKSSEANASAKSAKKPEDSREFEDLYEDLLQAVGLTSGKLPTYWLPQGAMPHIGRWISDLRLTKEEIIQAARESRKQHSAPPNGPKGLDRVMQSVAEAKSFGRQSPFAQRNTETSITELPPENRTVTEATI